MESYTGKGTMTMVAVIRVPLYGELYSGISNSSGRIFLRAIDMDV